MTSILIVEDDLKTSNAIRNGLREEGYDAVAARIGDEGFSLLAAGTFDLVVLDWMHLLSCWSVFGPCCGERETRTRSAGKSVT